MERNDHPTPEQIRHLARLSRLELSDDEVAAMVQHMDRIIEAVSTLQELDTSSVKPFSFEVSELEGKLREDDIRPSLPVEEALANAPRKGPRGFEVPAIHD